MKKYIEVRVDVEGVSTPTKTALQKIKPIATAAKVQI